MFVLQIGLYYYFPLDSTNSSPNAECYFTFKGIWHKVIGPLSVDVVDDDDDDCVDIMLVTSPWNWFFTSSRRHRRRHQPILAPTILFVIDTVLPICGNYYKLFLLPKLIRTIIVDWTNNNLVTVIACLACCKRANLWNLKRGKLDWSKSLSPL